VEKVLDLLDIKDNLKERKSFSNFPLTELEDNIPGHKTFTARKVGKMGGIHSEKLLISNLGLSSAIKSPKGLREIPENSEEAKGDPSNDSLSRDMANELSIKIEFVDELAKTQDHSKY